MRFLLLAFVLAGAAIEVFAAGDLLDNGGFERGLGGWSYSGGVEIEGGAAHHGKSSLRVMSGGAAQDLSGLPAGAVFTCAAALKVEKVEKTAGAGYAYLAVYQLGDFDELIAAQDFAQLDGTAGWREYRHTFQVAAGCAAVSIRCGLFQARGTAWFDAFTLVPGDKAVSSEALAAARLAAAKDMGLEAGAAGNIAILKDDFPPGGAPSSPEHLAKVLRQAGFGAAFLNAEQLASRELLDREVFDLVVLPYGASFPVAAAENFRRFLRQGGKFISMGGYAFDHLLERTPAGWRPAGDVPPPRSPAAEHAVWRFPIPAGELRGRGRLEFSGWLKAAKVAGPGMAYFAVYQIAPDGSLPEWKDLCQVRGTQDWKEFRHEFNVHPQAETVELRAGLYRCRGAACFDDLKLIDGSGHLLVEAGFEEEFDPESKDLKRWSRSSPELCSIETRVRRSGRRALKTKLDFEPPRPVRLNTRHGIPEDGLRTEPDQLGVFDPGYPLERARSARAAPGQCILDFRIELGGPLEGWAASGVAGFDEARWLPLLDAHDRYGRLRGAAGAMLRHYDGPYAGSSWAFFGVTSRDLFAEENPGMAGALAGLARSLVKDVYLASLIPEPACCRQGEGVRLLAAIFNGGREERKLRLSIEIFEGEPAITPDDPASAARPPLAVLAAEAVLPSGKSQLARLEWKPERFESDFYYLAGHLYDGSEEIDRLESGFMAWDERAVASGPRLRYRGNYLCLGERPMFLFGTDDWSYVFTTQRETPLQWLFDMRRRRDFGVQIYENLQFGLPEPPARAEELLRKVDGIVQLAQKYQQVYFPCLLVGYNVAAGDEELAREKEFCRRYAERYARVPGLIYYLNGDLRCQLSPATAPQWNEFLKARYGADEKLRQAWGDRAPKDMLGGIPAEDFNDWERDWGDVQVYDLNRFRAALIRRWCGALMAGIREHDREHPATAEFYQLPHQGVDLPAGIDGLDLANFGFFERRGKDLERFPLLSKYNDQRARGKSFGPGEYGVKMHPAWGDGKDHGYHTARSREEAIELFLGVAHYALGLGASRIHNWCWKDDAHRVFPWGMVHACDGVPKDTAYVHRNQSLLFRHLAPLYEEPAVYLLTADGHRMGGGKWQVIEGILRGIGLALSVHADNLGTLNEDGLEIPPAAKAIFYPLPYCPPDEAYEKLLDWVRRGGVLYLSGDLSYDELRRRARARRLEVLCGVRFVAENYPNIQVPAEGADSAVERPCIRVEPAGAKVLKFAAGGEPLVVENEVGRGRVFFTPEPLELIEKRARHPDSLALYRRVLAAAGLKPIGLEPDDPLIHAFRVPLRDGGRAYVLFNAGEAAREVTLTDLKPPASLMVKSRRPALLWLDGGGALRAVEVQGACKLGDEGFAQDGTDGIILSLDGGDLRRSRALLLLPLQAGAVRLAQERAWSGAAAETGELENGRWRAFERSAATWQGAELRIEVSGDQALSLILVCEESAAPRWREAIERAVKDPGSLP
ncbi:MAG: hypothetical protein HY717_13260 [Planctomycetes bacterium]|nr:hypothetical protein [Planctomycetota bacterium]